MAALTAFFEARRGRLHGFRFRDFADFLSCAPGVQPGAMDQAIGTGDGGTTEFQLAKTYGDHVRPIRKPVAGSVVVAVDRAVGFSFSPTADQSVAYSGSEVSVVLD